MIKMRMEDPLYNEAEGYLCETLIKFFCFEISQQKIFKSNQIKCKSINRNLKEEELSKLNMDHQNENLFLQ